MREDGILVQPNVFDALTARVAESIGFDSIGLGGFQIAAHLMGDSEPRLSLEDVATAVRYAHAAVSIPIVVDAGARRALVDGGKSLLPAGVRGVDGEFDADATVEIVDDAGAVFAKGLSRYTSRHLAAYQGRRTADLPEGFPHEVVHRDDLVVLP